MSGVIEIISFGRHKPVFTLQILNHGYWLPGYERSQIISSHGIDLVIQE